MFQLPTEKIDNRWKKRINVDEISLKWQQLRERQLRGETVPRKNPDINTCSNKS